MTVNIVFAERTDAARGKRDNDV